MKGIDNMMTVYVVSCMGIENKSTIAVYSELNNAIKRIRNEVSSYVADSEILTKKGKKNIIKAFDKWEKSLKNGLNVSLTESPCKSDDIDDYYTIEKFMLL